MRWSTVYLEVQFTLNSETAKVVTWGDPYDGGDSQEVQSQLHGVCQIQATTSSFAALREDGSVVSWGGLDDSFETWHEVWLIRSS